MSVKSIASILFSLTIYVRVADAAMILGVDQDEIGVAQLDDFSGGLALNETSAIYPRAGWQATLSTFAHGVRGTATIVDADTFRVDNFFFDGGGIDVHFILAASNDNSLFRTARLVADSLPSPGFRGTPFNGGSVTIDLPVGNTFDGYNAISLWCIPAQANFGSGTFISSVPEPSSAGLLAFGAILWFGYSRRR